MSQTQASAMWESFQTWASGISGVTIVAAFTGLLPPTAAALGLAWYLVQIYESKTFQSWLSRRRIRRVARLKREIERHEARLAPRDTGVADVRDVEGPGH